MDDLPKTREFPRAADAFGYQPVTEGRDELLARIAKLEALHDKAINRETEAKRERNELRDQLEQAEAELAPLRDRVRELEQQNIEDSGWLPRRA